MAAGAASAVEVKFELALRHGAKELILGDELKAAMMGRDAGCEIVIADPKASRQHARIERRRDKFFLTDQSTNGTYVTFIGEPEIVLRREEVMLRRSGRIAFGHSGAEAGGDSVEFSVKS
jgi:hypothetical protein